MHKPNRSFSQKVFAAGLAVTTALWAFGGLLTVAGAVEAHPAGTLVLSGTTVWHVSDDGTMRHGIDSLAKFLSHRYSFANVVPANSADLALPDGGLLGWGSGVLFNDGGTVYQVSGGTKHGFTSAAAFTGSGFSFGSVVNASLAGVTAGSNISDASMAHMEGTFVVSSGTVWRVSATGRQGVPQPGVLYSWGAGFGDVVAANSADLALANEGNASFRTGTLVNDSGTLFAVTATTKRGFPSASCYTGFGFNFSTPVAGSTAGLTAGANYCADAGTPTPPGPTPPPVSAGTVSVSLASDTPAAGTIVENAARVGFTKVNFTAGASDVIIDSMVVERTGISQDSNFTDIILLDVSGGVSVGVASQIGNEKTLGSTHQVTFADDITVKAGTTKSIMLAANMSGTLQAGETAALRLVSATPSGTATVSGSLPITGSTMTMNGTLAIVAVTIAAGSQNPAATTQQVGINDYIVSGVRVSANSVEDIEVQQMRFYQNGTAADGDVKDLELMVDGAVIATVSKPTSKEATFKLATPIVIKKGENKEFNVRLDIVDGSSRTISFDFDKKTDVVAIGKTYAYYMTPTYPNATSPFFNAPNTTIDSGALTFSKGVVASLNLAEGVNSQVIGAFKTTVQGEPVQVTRLVLNLTVTGTGNGADLTNIVVKDSAGKVVAGPIDGADNTGPDAATTTDTIIFPTGTNTYTVVANMNTDFAGNDTVQVGVDDPDSKVTAKGTVTNQTITANPTSTVTLDTLTVKTGSILVSTSTTPAAQNVLVGQTQFTFANFVLDATSSGEDVRVTALATVHRAVNSDPTNIANLTLYDGTTALSPIIQPSGTVSPATSTFSFTNPIVITKGSSKTLTLKGDIVSGDADSDTHAFGCEGTGCVTATGASTSTAITPTVTSSTGQTMSIVASGTFTVGASGTSPTQGANITGNSSKVTVGELLFTATNEDIDLTELHLGATAVNGGALNDEFSMVYLFAGSTQVASASPTTTNVITFQSLEGKFRIYKNPASGQNLLTIKVDTAAITNQGGDGNTGDSGDGVSLTVAADAYAGKGIASGSTISAANKSGTFDGQQYTVYKTQPTFARVPLSTTLADGDLGVFAFSLTADAKGDVGFYKAAFEISTTGVSITDFKLYEEYGTSNQQDLTTNAARQSSGELAAGRDYISILLDTGTDGVGQGGEFRFVGAGVTKTFQLRGTVANASAGDSMNVVLRNATGVGTHPGDAETVADEETGHFVWSDLHYGNSTPTATYTAEWFNGYRVPGLSATSTQQSLSKS